MILFPCYKSTHVFAMALQCLLPAISATARPEADKSYSYISRMPPRALFNVPSNFSSTPPLR
ncbi:MAG: hypothetical protein V1791_09125, partial [Pseudomonadota bacterium]